jgi:cell division protease FtsH
MEDKDKKQPSKGMNNFSKFSLIYILLGIFMVYMYQFYSKTEKTTITYSAFKNLVAQGKVKKCRISEKYIKGVYIDKDNKKKEFITIAVKDPELVKELQKHNVDFSGTITNTWLTNLIFGWILPFGFLFFLWWMMTKKMRGTSGGLFGFGKSRFKVYLNEKPDVKFADVAGAEEAKQEIEEIVEYLKDPQKYKRLGGRAPKGVLLVGVPGTGKTLLAKATAGEAGTPFISISGSEFVEMFVGVGASRVRDLFNEAKKLSPCIVFIDEIDAIGKSRALNSLTSNDEREQTLNQLLAEMDGFDSSVGVIIMAATNRPEVLDPALMRPGRFDRQIIVDKPDVKGREAIIRVHIKKIKIGDDVDIETLAKMTPGLVGADLANIVNEAALLAARENKDAVHMEHFEEAIERQLAGLKKKNRVIKADEKKRVAYHESGHAIIAYLLPGADPVHKISIVPRGLSALGYTQQLPTDEKYLITKEDMLDKVAVLFGGRAAEEIVFGSISTGAQNDLMRATDIVRAIITQFGMDEKLGLMVVEKQGGNKFLTADGMMSERDEVSEKTKELIDDEVSKIMQNMYEKAKNILMENRDKLETLSKELLDKEIINEEELKEVMEGKNEVQD